MPFSGPEDLHAAFAAALEAQDVDALVDLYEPDAMIVAPDGSQISGDARREWFAGLIAAGVGATGRQRKMLIADDIALSSTAYEMDPGPTGGEPATMATAEVSRRQPDGTWRVVIDAPNFS